MARATGWLAFLTIPEKPLLHYFRARQNGSTPYENTLYDKKLLSWYGLERPEIGN